MTKEKIAQGVRAFANNGDGYMVYGFGDENADRGSVTEVDGDNKQ